MNKLELLEETDQNPENLDEQFHACIDDDEQSLCSESSDDNVLGLLLASRQLHAETSLLLYKLSIFEFELDLPQDDEAAHEAGELDAVVREFLHDRSAIQIGAITKMEIVTYDDGEIVAEESGTGVEWAKIYAGGVLKDSVLKNKLLDLA